MKKSFFKFDMNLNFRSTLKLINILSFFGVMGLLGIITVISYYQKMQVDEMSYLNNLTQDIKDIRYYGSQLHQFYNNAALTKDKEAEEQAKKMFSTAHNDLMEMVKQNRGEPETVGNIRLGVDLLIQGPEPAGEYLG